MFDIKILILLPDKADLQNELIKKVPVCVITDQPLYVLYVINGGAMLHCLPWPKSALYTNICRLYINFIHNHYQHVLVAFDGSGIDPSTKDETHQRRTVTDMGVDVDFPGDMILKMKKRPFLAKPRSKQKLINILSSQMGEEDIQVKQSSGDADYDIAMSVCSLAETGSVVVVGDDFDLLILLQYHFKPGKHSSIYLQTS